MRNDFSARSVAGSFKSALSVLLRIMSASSSELGFLPMILSENGSHGEQGRDENHSIFLQ
jgi:hypothetical protein